jgi:hypothetical protein
VRCSEAGIRGLKTGAFGIKFLPGFEERVGRSGVTLEYPRPNRIKGDQCMCHFASKFGHFAPEISPLALLPLADGSRLGINCSPNSQKLLTRIGQP